MANRVHPTPIDADNSSGSLPAVRNDWRLGDADSMSARDTNDPTNRCRIYDCRRIPNSHPIGQPLAVEGESIYDQLDSRSVIVEIIVFCFHRERHIDLKEGLPHRVGLLDIPQLHDANARLGVDEGGSE